MVAALAGRRIDASDAEVPRFPARMKETVRQRLRDLLLARDAAALVASGACGADLLALEVAGELGLRRRMVLPFEPERFRSTSVTDRSDPERWGRLFDEVMEALAPDDLVVLPEAGEGSAAYAAANETILDHALRLAGEDGAEGVLAVLVWEGRPRGAGDLTEAFGSAARARGIEVAEVRTR